MGLMVHSLENVPHSENRDYMIYLLDYGWEGEPIAETLNENFGKMAGFAAKNKAVIIKGTELSHFNNEVFSWHQINNEPGENVLPAILITNAHPSYFKFNDQDWHKRGIYRESKKGDIKLILIPLKKFCSKTTEVLTLIESIFSDIEAKRDLSKFKIAKQTEKGIGTALVDAIIFEPNFSGMGFSFNKLINFFKAQK